MNFRKEIYVRDEIYLLFLQYFKSVLKNVRAQVIYNNNNNNNNNIY